MKKTKKMNNKGFSLMELIIVVAIMAVLVVVLAPQYLKYVERSRNSTDQANAAAIESALLVWGSETEGSNLYTAGKEAVVTVSSTGTAVTGDNKTAAEAALTSAGLSTTATKCVSKNAWTSYTVTVSVDSKGTVKVTRTI